MDRDSVDDRTRPTVPPEEYYFVHWSSPPVNRPSQAAGENIEGVSGTRYEFGNIRAPSASPSNPQLPTTTSTATGASRTPSASSSNADLPTTTHIEDIADPNTNVTRRTYPGLFTTTIANARMRDEVSSQLRFESQAQWLQWRELNVPSPSFLRAGHLEGSNNVSAAGRPIPPLNPSDARDYTPQNQDFYDLSWFASLCPDRWFADGVSNNPEVLSDSRAERATMRNVNREGITDGEFLQARESIYEFRQQRTVTFAPQRIHDADIAEIVRRCRAMVDRGVLQEHPYLDYYLLYGLYYCYTRQPAECIPYELLALIRQRRLAREVVSAHQDLRSRHLRWQRPPPSEAPRPQASEPLQVPQVELDPFQWQLPSLQSRPAQTVEPSIAPPPQVRTIPHDPEGPRIPAVSYPEILTYDSEVRDPYPWESGFIPPRNTAARTLTARELSTDSNLDGGLTPSIVVNNGSLASESSSPELAPPESPSRQISNMNWEIQRTEAMSRSQTAEIRIMMNDLMRPPTRQGSSLTIWHDRALPPSPSSSARSTQSGRNELSEASLGRSTPLETPPTTDVTASVQRVSETLSIPVPSTTPTSPRPRSSPSWAQIERAYSGGVNYGGRDFEFHDV